MKPNPRHGLILVATLALSAGSAQAAGGYFILGYGPKAHQTAGTSAATGFDGFSGATNPAKLSVTPDRLDLGVLAFMPYRRVERRGSDTPYDFSSKSNQSFFALPEIGFARRIDEHWSWGVSLYGNGGLNTDYRGDTGIPDTNANPARCGSKPGNFFFGCGQLGFDLAQVIVAPTVSYKIDQTHSVGVAPLVAYQQIKFYGLQAFEGISSDPDALTNQGYDGVFGTGVRLGWFGRLHPWLDAGLSYSTRIYMQVFDEYRGLIADGGDFDIPANFSIGLALRPIDRWEFALDIQRIFYGEIPALRNGVLNSLQDPSNRPLGSRDGSGFNWRHQTNYRTALAWKATPVVTIRAGFAYGRRPQADNTENSVSFNMLAPNPIRNITGGLTWTQAARNEWNLAAGQYLEGTYRGPSATAGLGVGGQEAVTAHVTTFMLSWTRRFGI